METEARTLARQTHEVVEILFESALSTLPLKNAQEVSQWLEEPAFKSDVRGLLPMAHIFAPETSAPCVDLVHTRGNRHPLLTALMTSVGFQWADTEKMYLDQMKASSE